MPFQLAVGQGRMAAAPASMFAKSSIQAVQPSRPLAARPRQRATPATAAAGRASGNASTARGSSGGAARESLVSDGAIKSLSPEARRIFREAQDNIIELNKSRLRALEELKAARQKIAELEGKLDSAVAEASQATAQLQQLGTSAQQAAAEAAAAATAAAQAAFEQQKLQLLQQQQQDMQRAAQQQWQQQQAAQQQQQAVQQQPPPQAPAPQAAVGGITVVYETGWTNAYLHHNVDGRGWTTTPGERMENGTQQFPGKKVITVPGSRLEFVINDGGSDWDKPGHGASNYVAVEPGTYRVKNGKLTRLA